MQVSWSAGMIFSLRFGVTVSGGESFQGDAGGLSTPGAGARFGDVSTDNLARLYSDTRSFQLIAMAGLFSVRSSTPRAGAGRGEALSPKPAAAPASGASRNDGVLPNEARRESDGRSRARTGDLLLVRQAL
jgi:hypothetical protein